MQILFKSCLSVWNRTVVLDICTWFSVLCLILGNVTKLSDGELMKKWQLNIDVVYVKGYEEFNRESAEAGCVKCFGCIWR